MTMDEPVRYCGLSNRGMASTPYNHCHVCETTYADFPGLSRAQFVCSGPKTIDRPNRYEYRRPTIRELLEAKR